MNVLKATDEQKQQLEGFYINGAYLQFVKDSLNNNIVTDAVLYDDNFLSIRDILNSLPIIEYVENID
jgi:hypothetical protein